MILGQLTTERLRSRCFQLKILRVLVEMQLQYALDIKNAIDRAWGVTINKSKKKDPTLLPPGAEDPKSVEHLQLVPLGQDMDRKRYWVIDGPCILLVGPLSKLFARICGHVRLHARWPPPSILVLNI